MKDALLVQMSVALFLAGGLRLRGDFASLIGCLWFAAPSEPVRQRVGAAALR